MLAGEYPMQSLQSHQTSGYLDQNNMLFSNGVGELKASHRLVYRLERCPFALV